jgi:hypothetical protein
MRKTFEYFSLERCAEIDIKIARAIAAMPFYVLQWENNDFRLRVPYVAFKMVRLMSLRQLESETGRLFRWKKKKKGLTFEENMIIYDDLRKVWADLPLHVRQGGTVTEPITVEVDPLEIENPDKLIMYLKYRP